jgi:hypothetical protein
MPFLIIMVVGLIGLLLMALPGIQHHGHVGAVPRITPPHGGLHVGHSAGAHGAAHALPTARGAAPPPAHAAPAPGTSRGAEAPPGYNAVRLIPSPRAIFSMLTLFGAFGAALMPVLHFWQLAALAAVVPAWGIEVFAVRPLWNLMFQFQGKPTTPIEALVACDAKAVTPFRNGRGLVAIEHDGRLVQFSARLQEAHANLPVRVGDTLCIEEVDAASQRVLVSVK